MKTPIKTHSISSKTDQDTDQETWILISLNTKYSIFAASIITSRTPSFISASKQRRNRTNLRKTTHQIQFPKQCILKFWTMPSKSCQLPVVSSVQRIQSFGSIFLLQITLEGINDTINSLGRVSSTGLFSYLHHEFWQPIVQRQSVHSGNICAQSGNLV